MNLNEITVEAPKSIINLLDAQLLTEKQLRSASVDANLPENLRAAILIALITLKNK